MKKLSVSQQKTLINALCERFTADFSVFTPLLIRNVHLGFVNTEFARLLRRDLTHHLRPCSGCLNIQADTWLQAADLLESTARDWHNAGFYDGWRGEKFDVSSPEGEVLFALERSAFRVLGFLSHAIHINGYIQKNDEYLFWVGRRSPFKAVDPDKLDNLTGGGIASGETAHQAMMREGFEEAGLPENLLRNIKENGRRLSLRSVHRGLHREWLHLFDVLLPEKFTPENQDGEVSSFCLMTADEIVQAIADGCFMNDAALAVTATFIRLGLMPDAPELNFQAA